MPRPARRPRRGGGRITLDFGDGRAWSRVAAATNTQCYGLLVACARAAGMRDPAYQIAGIYLEFANAAPPIAVPATAQSDTVAYYRGLAGTPGRDFVRATLLPASLDVDPAYAGLLPAGQGNRVTFFAQAPASGAGVLGTPFSAAAGSVVIGVGLVAMPAPDDPTQDVLCARGYYDVADQLVVPAAGQVRAGWSVTFGMGA